MTANPYRCQACGHPHEAHWTDDHRHCGECPGAQHLCEGKQLISVSMEIPPVTFVIACAGKPVLWKLTEAEAREIYAELGKRLTELDGKRQAKWAHGEPPSF